MENYDWAYEKRLLKFDDTKPATEFEIRSRIDSDGNIVEEILIGEKWQFHGKIARSIGGPRNSQ